MSKKIKLLQIGTQDWSSVFKVPEKVELFSFPLGHQKEIREKMKNEKIKSFSAIIVDSKEGFYDLLELQELMIPYAVFYDESLQILDPKLQELIKKKCAVPTDFSDPNELLRLLSKVIFPLQYGDKLFPFFTEVHPWFTGEVTYNGHESIRLNGEYGQEFQTIISWGYNIHASKEQPIELWLEYEKEGDCECQLVLHVIPEGSILDVVTTKIVTEEEMMQGAIVLDYDMGNYISASLEVKGSGRIKVGNLHQRLTRRQFGKFVLGGGILHDEKRQEINYFFHPGDFKPPLSVYFSGFRPAEGFEGYGMMSAFGTPFLLFSDPRLLGGAFYLGTDELENSIKATIQYYLDYLGFTKDQLILSGMSMGTFPSMYYGADFEPRAIITSKPLANIGTISQRARLLAPDVFPTGIDVLHLQTNGLEQSNIEQLNKKFWEKFEKADFSKTVFGFSYMKDEDMDPTAYEDVTESLYYSGAKIMSKGTSGRHNDDSATATTWFVNFYKMILESDFGRKEE